MPIIGVAEPRSRADARGWNPRGGVPLLDGACRPTPRVDRVLRAAGLPCSVRCVILFVEAHPCSLPVATTHPLSPFLSLHTWGKRRAASGFSVAVLTPVLARVVHCARLASLFFCFFVGADAGVAGWEGPLLRWLAVSTRCCVGAARCCAVLGRDGGELSPWGAGGPVGVDA